MDKNKRINVTPQSQQENASLTALKTYLQPWRLSLVDQRDDYGRDGYIQVVDEDKDGAFISPLTFWVQSKSVNKSFSDQNWDSIEVRHLELWTHSQASPIILVLWSAIENKFRFRSALPVIEELNRTTSIWREQKTVTVNFHEYDEYLDPSLAKEKIKRILQNELDRKGGIDQYHSTKRKVLLTTLFSKGENVTSEIISLDSSINPEKIDISIGEGWLANDVDSYEISAEHILISSLFLYEEVWFPHRNLKNCVAYFGKEKTIELLEKDRLKPYYSPYTIGFFRINNALLGDLGKIKPAEDDFILSSLKRFFIGCDVNFIKKLRSFVEFVDGVDIDRIIKITSRNLRIPVLLISAILA